MDEQKGMTPEELEAQANAILAAADLELMDALEPMEPQPIRKKSKKKADNAEKDNQPIVKLEDKVVAALPAAAVISANEKLLMLLSKGKKKGKLELEYYGVDDLNDLLELLEQLPRSKK